MRFLNSDRIIYIDADVLASFYAVFQLIILAGFSADQSVDRQLACVWQNVLKYAIVNTITSGGITQVQFPVKTSI